MSNPRTLASALAAGLLLAGSVRADNHGVEALPGDRFTGAIAPGADTDAFEKTAVIRPGAPGSPASGDGKTDLEA